MKKFLALLLAATIMFTMTACGGSRKTHQPCKPSDTPAYPHIHEPSADTPKPVTEPTPKPVTEPTPESATDTPEPVTDTPEPVTEPTTEPIKTEEPSEPVDGMRPEVKDAIDKYEAFVDEYCAFMKKYTDEGNPITMLADYTEMVIQLTEMAAAFSELGEQDLNDAELAYFLEVQLRVNQKLLDLEVYISEHSGNG